MEEEKEKESERRRLRKHGKSQGWETSQRDMWFVKPGCLCSECWHSLSGNHEALWKT